MFNAELEYGLISLDVCWPLINLVTFWLFFYTNIRSCRYLVNPTREVKWHWLSLCFACGAVLSKETGIMALAINVGFGLYRSYTSRLKLRNTFKRLFWTDTLTVKYFFLALVSGKSFDGVLKFQFLFQLFVLLSIRMVVQNSSLPEFSAQDNPAAFHKSILTR